MQSEFMAETSGNTEHKLALNVFSELQLSLVFKNFSKFIRFFKKRRCSRFFIEDFVNSNQKSDKTNAIFTRFFKNYSFFQKTKVWVVFSLMISLIQTKILEKQLHLLLGFSKFSRFFNKRLIFPKTNLFLRQFSRFFKKTLRFFAPSLQMGRVSLFININ